LFSANEIDIEIAWFSPQSEYRPTEYLQHWVQFWFDDDLRLAAAREFQQLRLARLNQSWTKLAQSRNNACPVDIRALEQLLKQAAQGIKTASNQMELLTEEGRLTKQLYRLIAEATRHGDFVRSQRGNSVDTANQFLDHGNYLAYGLAATATWVLGLPHGLAVLHGKTRRGGLVFDVADLVKDALILPQAFISTMRGDTEQEFRQACIESLTSSESLDFMIDTLKAIALKIGRLAQAQPHAGE
jgi:CRISPR-associated protein Cas1